MNKMINFSIVILFLTNVWTFLYIKIIDYLNYFYPAKMTEVFFNSSVSFPEPFEIVFYVLTITLFIGFIFLISREKLQTGIDHRLNSLRSGKYLLFAFLLLLFIGKLGRFPLAGELITYQAQPDKSIYIFSYLSILLFISFFIAEVYFIQKLIPGKKIQLIIGFLTLSFILGLSMFNPHFTFSIADMAFFYGPIYDIAQGKTIFTDIRSDYGFLSILFFTIIHTISNLKFVYAPVLLLLFDLIEYLIFFYLIFKASRSLLYSFLGLFSFLIINYYSGTFGPQASAIRWLPLVLTLLFVYKLRRIDHKFLLLLLPIFCFWSIDSGIQLMLGYLFTLGLMFLAKKIGFKRLLKTGAILFLSFVLTISLIQGLHLLSGYRFVDLFKMYHIVRKYALAGESMVPMEAQTYFWLYLLLYFSAIFYFFKKKGQFWQVAEVEGNPDDAQLGPIPQRASAGGKPLTESAKKEGNLAEIILLSANFMFFVSMYYVGRSNPHELFSLSIFPLLTFFLLIGQLYLRASYRTRFTLLVLLFIFLIAFPLKMRIEYVTARILEKYQGYKQGKIFTVEIDKLMQEKYGREIGLINSNIKEDNAIILAHDESYIFYFTGKKNILDQNPVSRGIQMQSEIAPALRQLPKNCPKKIAVNCEVFGKCSNYSKLTYEDNFTFPIVLAEIEKICRTKYTPSVCTDKLCIGEGN